MFINMAVSLGGITLTNTLVLFSISNAVDSSGRHHVLSILHDYTYDFGPFLHMHVFSFKNAHACFLLLLLACSLIDLSFSCSVSWQRILWVCKSPSTNLHGSLWLVNNFTNHTFCVIVSPYETLIWYNK